jgi:hypothetical protein
LYDDALADTRPLRIYFNGDAWHAIGTQVSARIRGPNRPESRVNPRAEDVDRDGATIAATGVANHPQSLWITLWAFPGRLLQVAL